MNQDVFKYQMQRLKTRFGDKHFDNEFVSLAWLEVKSMVPANFIRSIDLWIGNRPHNRPPLLAEFKEARLAEEKVRVSYAATEAMRNFERPGARTLESFQRVMKPLVGHVNSVKEAVEIRRIQIQAKRAKDPSYDPMTDPEWNGPGAA